MSTQARKVTLEGRHLFRSFGSGETTTEVLHDVSLDLGEGQVLLLMGPSGSGKSTLLAVLSGLLRPTNGDVSALGQSLWKLSDRALQQFRLRHCGFIFQGYNLFPSLTAREQLEMVLRWGEGASGRDARKRVDEMLGVLGMGGRGDLRADQLSGGEKQRVAIARALIKQPSFCFADEPTSSLDWVHGEQVIELLQYAAHKRGATIFVVAHDPRIVPYADRVCYLEDGRLVPSPSNNKEPGRVSTVSSPMNSIFSRRGVWLLALLVLGVGTPVAGILWTRSATDSASPAGEVSSGKSSSDASQHGQGVVCFGHVDLEHGVSTLYPLQPGRVVEVLAQEGTPVRAGDVLVRLEDAMAKSRLVEAEAGLEAAELQLTRARKLPEQHRNRIAQQKDAVEAMRSRLAAARRTLARKQELSERRLLDASETAISEDQVRELEAMERGEEKRLDELTRQDPSDDEKRIRKEVDMARAKVEQARLALADCTLKAPRDGTPLRVLVGPGDIMTGQPRQPAILFARDGPKVIRAEVEQEFIGRVKEQMPVVVEDENGSDDSWSGKVKRVAQWFTQRRSVMQEPSEFNDVRTVECLITLDEDNIPLRIGQRVRVRIGVTKPQ